YVPGSGEARDCMDDVWSLVAPRYPAVNHEDRRVAPWRARHVVGEWNRAAVAIDKRRVLDSNCGAKPVKRLRKTLGHEVEDDGSAAGGDRGLRMNRKADQKHHH